MVTVPQTEERCAAPAVLCDAAFGTNVETNCVATSIARTEWPNLAVAAFANELASAEQRLEVVSSLLI